MTPNTPPDEAALMARICQRDQTALTELYDKFAPMIYGMSMRVLGQAALAEEATQDTFMKIWRKADDWNPERGKLVTWMLTIARYTAIDRLRQETRQTPDGVLSLDDMLPRVGRSEAMDDTWHDVTVVRSLAQRLPIEQREAIELAFFKGMTHIEIADHLNEPLGTVKSRIRDGLGKLRGWWMQEQEDE